MFFASLDGMMLAHEHAPLNVFVQAGASYLKYTPPLPNGQPYDASYLTRLSLQVLGWLCAGLCCKGTAIERKVAAGPGPCL